MSELFFDVGNKLRQIRKSKGLTLKEVGDKLNLTGQAVGNYEHNKREISYNLLLKFAEIYDINASTLLNIPNELKQGNVFNDVIKTNAHLETDFDVVITGNISQKAYDEIMSFVDYIKIKYGYPLK